MGNGPSVKRKEMSKPDSRAYHDFKGGGDGMCPGHWVKTVDAGMWE